MSDAFLIEVLVPMRDQLGAHVISLVDKQDELFGVLGVLLRNLSNVLLEVLRVKEVGVSTIHDLEKEIRFFDNTPKLFPNLQVLFEGRDG